MSVKANLEKDRELIGFSNVPLNGDKPQPRHSKFCLIDIFSCVTLLLIFAFNFYFTINAFVGSRIINLNPEILCHGLVNEFNYCINKNKNNTWNNEITTCTYEGHSVEECYDNVALINRRCFIFVSELDKCVIENIANKNNSTQIKSELNLKCMKYVKDVTQCSGGVLQIDLELLFKENGEDGN